MSGRWRHEAPAPQSAGTRGSHDPAPAPALPERTLSMRTIDVEHIEAIALGASVYGTGGGGDPYVGKLIAMNMVRRHGPVRLVDVGTLADDALVVPVALVGAPTVAIEKFPSTGQFIGALEAIEKYLGRKVSAVMCAEAGGLNSTIPFAVASQVGLPLLDGDLMGRAFPEIQMTLATLHGIKATPMALCDDKGNSVVMDTVTNQYTERFVRSLATDMGGSACTVLYPMTGAQARLATIPGSLTMLQRAGETLIAARRDKRDPVAALVELLGARRLFEGKVIDVQRVTAAGWNRGTATIAGFHGEGHRRCQLRFQNEFLIAEVDGAAVATTPDLIALLDVETGEPVTAELLRYGLRVTLVGFPCHPQWRTPAGIDLAGPRYFGYDVDYSPIDATAKEA